MFLSYNLKRFDLGHGVVAAVSSCRDIMVMFPFVCGYDSFWVCRRPLDMLAYVAPSTSTFVVAPVDRLKCVKRHDHPSCNKQLTQITNSEVLWHRSNANDNPYVTKRIVEKGSNLKQILLKLNYISNKTTQRDLKSTEKFLLEYWRVQTKITQRTNKQVAVQQESPEFLNIVKWNL